MSRAIEALVLIAGFSRVIAALAFLSRGDLAHAHAYLGRNRQLLLSALYAYDDYSKRSYRE
jgi:hypothetical protein